jgi:3-oxoacyl-[acyl-carrier-protein] synthase-3
MVHISRRLKSVFISIYTLYKIPDVQEYPMAISRVKNITITGIVSVLPKQIRVNVDGTSGTKRQEVERIVDSTGIHSLRVASPEQTSLDLGFIACKNLLKKMKWSVDDISLIIFVTQTPDYPLPGNAVQLQHKLGLNKGVLAFDVNLGCSGFVYGLWQVSQLLSGLSGSKALLIVGDTTTQQYSATNHTVSLLFGDAASAVAIEKSPGCDDMVFSMGSDGAGAPYLIQPNGGAKNKSLAPEIFMDGLQVFVFTLREIPQSIAECLTEKGWSIDSLDYCVMHQANKMMLQKIAKKLGLSEEQLIISMAEVGNTSSASIPLALCISLSSALTERENRLLFSGFGVGWSWGTVALKLNKLKTCQIIDMAKYDD